LLFIGQQAVSEEKIKKNDPSETRIAYGAIVLAD
jgi:hypothetical protein